MGSKERESTAGETKSRARSVLLPPPSLPSVGRLTSFFTSQGSVITGDGTGPWRFKDPAQHLAYFSVRQFRHDIQVN